MDFVCGDLTWLVVVGAADAEDGGTAINDSMSEESLTERLNTLSINNLPSNNR